MTSKPYTIIAFVTLLLLIGCSAQKNTGLSRAYHNLTARYNVLFNGNESFKDGVEKIDKEYKDDYSVVLPLFKYSNKEVVSIAGTEMDRTIKKCSKLITLHSISAKPKVNENKTLSPSERAFFSKKEYNRFVDDAYLLMGKAHFYKHEFTQASDIFKKVMNDFKGQPIVFDAQIWQARVSVETGQFISASDILASLINNSEIPDRLLPELYTTNADFYLKQKDYPKAVENLHKAIELEKHKKIKTRYYFILAQLYEKNGELKRASDAYATVIKMNPSYEMAFNAHINRALAYEQGFGQADAIENELNKMLHDDKNIEYNDQIYYALGNLALKEGNKEKALEYYKLSLDANSENEKQEIRSFLTIADIYYSIPDYPYAQAFYDSALNKIDADFPGYNTLFTKSRSLTRLVEAMNTVTFSDSVLLLASLSQADLNIKIDNLIEQERQRQDEERQKANNAQLDQQFGQETSDNIARQSLTGNSSQWYFYNTTAKTQGFREFKLRWGNRRLEDHWQRASKILTAFIPGTADEEVTGVSEPRPAESSFDKLSRGYYTTNIPFTDSAKTARLKQVEESLYSMSLIYKDELKDYNKANESFRELIKRFPNSSYLLAAYYNLYSIAREQNNQAMIDYYKNLIATRFPNSTYAKVLTDPNYFLELERQDRLVQQLYEQTYKLYKAGNYSEVIYRSNDAEKNHPDHSLTPKFQYLRILALGKSLDRSVFRDSLISIATRYPETDIAADAQNIIEYMDQEHPEYREAQEVKISKTLYSFEAESKHRFIFALSKKISTNQLVFNIINFNLDKYDSLNLIVDVISINAEQNLVSVKTFNNSKQVQQYLREIVASEEIHKDLPDFNLNPFIISERNLNILLEDKSVDRYLKFFNESYQ